MNQASVDQSQPYVDHHWTDGSEGAPSYRGFAVTILSLAIVVGTAFFIWWSMRRTELPRTHYAAWYSADYGDARLPSIPFAAECAAAFSEGIEARGAKGVETLGEPRPLLEGSERANQEALRLAQATGGDGGKRFRPEDVLLVYLRTYAVDGPADDGSSGELGQEGDGGGYRAWLLTGGAGRGERVEVGQIFERLAGAEVSAVVVLLDTSDLESDLAEGVLVNGFPEAVERLVGEARGPGWSRLWVISSGSLLQPGHLFWPTRRSLLSAAVSPGDWSREDENGDGWISLAEFYERVLRYGDFHTDGRQSPRLLRGGRGACRVDERDPDWRVAAATRMFRTQPRSDAESGDAEPGGDGGEQDGEADRRDASRDGEGEELGESKGAETGEGTGDDEDASGDGENEDEAGEVEAVAGWRSRFAAVPREATWRVVERALSRETPGGWSPVDYAPDSWNRILRDMVHLDRRHRAGEVGDDVWSPYFELMLHLSYPDRVPAPALAGSYRALGDVLSAWQDEGQSWRPRATMWVGGSDRLRPEGRDVWPEMRESLRGYSDAMAELTWWVELAGRVDLNGLGDLQSVLSDARVDFERATIDPATDADRIIGRGSEIAAAREAVRSSLGELVARCLEATRHPWLRAAQIDRLLRSPLLSWSQRAQLERAMEALSKPGEVIERNAPLVEVWERGQSAAGGVWGRVAEWAERQRSLLGLVAGSREGSAVAGLPSGAILDLAAARRWGRAYVRFWAGTGDGDPTDFSHWRRAVLAGPHAPQGSGQPEPAAMVIRLRTDPTLRLVGTGESGQLVTQEAGVWKLGEPLVFRESDVVHEVGGVRLAFEDRPDPVRCRLKVGRIEPESAAGALVDFVRLTLGDGREVAWSELRRDGVEVALERGGELNLGAEVSDPSESGWDLPVTLDLTVEAIASGPLGQRVATLRLELEPPLPDHVDLWVTPAGDGGEPRDADDLGGAIGRRARPLGSRRTDAHELLHGAEALLTIAGDAEGVPYRIWAVNRSRKPRAIRGRLFAVTQVDGILRPGRLTDRQAVTAPSQQSRLLSLIRRIREGKERAWAESGVVRLPSAAGAPGGGIDAEREARVPDHAEPLAFQTVGGGEEPLPLALPHGMLCVFEEMEEIDAGELAEGEEPGPTRWRRPAGAKSWFKWLEVSYHPTLRVRGAGVMGTTLVEVDSPEAWRYSGRRGELEFAIRAVPSHWARYGLEKLPVAVRFGGRLQGEWELSVDEPEIRAGVRIGPNGDESPRSLDLTIGGFPRLVSYSVVSRGIDEPRIETSVTARRAELLDLSAVTDEGEPLFETMTRPDGREAIVLRTHEEVEGRRVPVRYRGLRGSSRFDAPWTNFQEFGDPGRRDRVELVLRERLGEEVETVERYSPRRERYRIELDPKAQTPRLIGEITDHDDLSFGTDPSLLTEGAYEVLARIRLGGVVEAESEVIGVVVDRSPPRVGSPRRIATSSGVLELWGGEKLELKLASDDELTEVIQVRLFLVRETGERSDVSFEAQAVGEGQWQAVLDAGELEAAKLPSGRYRVAAVATDLAGNDSSLADAPSSPLDWRNRPRPEPSSDDGDGPMNSPTEPAKAYPVRLSVTRGDFPLRTEHLRSVRLTSKPPIRGARSIRNDEILIEEVPAGTYELELTQTIRTGTFIGVRELVVPDDVEGGDAVRIRLLADEEK